MDFENIFLENNNNECYTNYMNITLFILFIAFILLIVVLYKNKNDLSKYLIGLCAVMGGQNKGYTGGQDSPREESKDNTNENSSVNSFVTANDTTERQDSLGSLTSPVTNSSGPVTKRPGLQKADNSIRSLASYKSANSTSSISSRPPNAKDDMNKLRYDLEQYKLIPGFASKNSTYYQSLSGTNHIDPKDTTTKVNINNLDYNAIKWIESQKDIVDKLDDNSKAMYNDIMKIKRPGINDSGPGIMRSIRNTKIIPLITNILNAEIQNTADSQQELKDDLKNKLDEQQRKLSEIQAKLDLDNQNKELLEKQLLETNQKLEQYKEQSKQLLQKQDNCQGEVESLKAELKKSIDQNNKNLELLNSQKLQLEESLRQIDNSNKLIEELRSKLESLATKNTGLLSKLASNEQQMLDNTKRISELQSGLEQSHQDNREEIQRLINDNGSIARENGSLKNKIIELENIVKQEQENLQLIESTYHDSTTNLENEIAELKKINNNLQNALDHQEDDYEHVVNNLETKNEELQEKINMITDDYGHEVDNLQTQNDQLQKKIDTMASDYDSEVNSLQTQIEKLNGQLNDYQNTLNNNIELKDKRIKEIENEIELRNQNIKKLEDNINELIKLYREEINGIKEYNEQLVKEVVLLSNKLTDLHKLYVNSNKVINLRLQSLETTTAEIELLKNNIKGLDSRLNDAQMRIFHLEEQSKKQQDTLDIIEKENEDREIDIDHFGKKLDLFESKFDDLTGQIKSITLSNELLNEANKGDLTDLISKFSALQVSYGLLSDNQKEQYDKIIAIIRDSDKISNENINKIKELLDKDISDVKGVIKDIREEIALNKKVNDDQNERIIELNNEIESIKNKESVNERVNNDQNEQIVNIDNRIENIEKVSPELQRRYNIIKEEFDAKMATLEQFKIDNATDHASYNNQLEIIHSGIEDIWDMLGINGNDIQANRSLLDRVVDAVNTLDRRIKVKANKTDIVDLQQSIDAINKRIDSLRKHVDDENHDQDIHLNAHDQEIDTLQNDLTNLKYEEEEKIDNIEYDIATLKVKNDDINKSQTEQIDRLNEEINQLLKLNNTISQRERKLEEKMSEVENLLKKYDTTVLVNKIDTLEKELKNVKGQSDSGGVLVVNQGSAIGKSLETVEKLTMYTGSMNGKSVVNDSVTLDTTDFGEILSYVLSRPNVKKYFAVSATKVNGKVKTKVITGNKYESNGNISVNEYKATDIDSKSLGCSGDICKTLGSFKKNIWHIYQLFE
jgi:chromosome segregation ATPase